MREADRSRASIFEDLTSAHFENEKPGRTAMYRMLKGNNLTWEFIEAVADICTETREHLRRILDEARPVWAKSQANPTPLANPVDQTQQQLIDVLTQLAETQKELLRVRQVREVSDQALVKANQMVWMLLMVIGQLESQIITLKHGLSGLTQRKSDTNSRSDLEGSISFAEVQRITAQTELERAKKERDAALQVSTEATISAQALQEDAQLLRVVNNLGRDEELERPLPALPSLSGTADSANNAEDLSEALQRIKQELDYGEEEIEEVRRLLHGDNFLREVDESVIVGEVITPVTVAAKQPKRLSVPLQRSEESPQRQRSAFRTRAEVAGQGPLQVLRMADVMGKRGGDAAVRTLFRSAAALQTNTERSATATLLSRLRRGEELTEAWNEVCSSTSDVLDLPSEPKGNDYSFSLDGYSFSVHPLRGNQRLSEIAQAIGFRIGPEHQPRFAAMERRGQADLSLLIAVKSSEIEELREITGRIIGRIDNPPPVFLVSLQKLPIGDLRSSLLRIQPWHEGGSSLLG
ncbi:MULTISPECIES: hypothetical protein [unclassified Streptomyces]|uniref:hypothetical protein n=1 Tax=unclassified Streptomyces TaxID=2593676 RepID=UPI002E2E27F5|nr:hypothetical protein [Streptomyces sp. NBC_00228]